jgi:hypothetical protein
MIEVIAVDMRIYTEQATEYGANGVPKGPWEWNTLRCGQRDVRIRNKEV